MEHNAPGTSTATTTATTASAVMYINQQCIHPPTHIQTHITYVCVAFIFVFVKAKRKQFEWKTRRANNLPHGVDVENDLRK